MTRHGGTSRRIPEIFALVSEAPTGDRADILDRECGSDAMLRAEVETLLEHADVPWTAFDEAAEAVSHALSSYGGEDEAAMVDPPAVERIGAYRVIRILGRGGMGVVYLAEQENPRRTVALKVIRSDGSSRMLRRRFEREAQVLGRLQHPGIAQIFEAGFADMGQGQQPYFAMEYVDGVPLHEYVKREQVEQRERVELIIRICDAVQHAHDRGVIHRDLKPGNILVTSDGSPHLLDFGIARLVERDAPDMTMPTVTGQLVGTVAYMSPEQIAGRVHDVGPRSDVYALGVILYQILSGRLPHDVSTLPIPQAVRQIEEEEPTPLSQVSRVYRGDLNTIVGKALEREPGRRYASAAELQRDLQRHLQHEPIVARPPSRVYRGRKFVRRNKVVVAATTTVVLVLIAGIIGIGLAAVEANRQRDDVQRQFRRAQLVNEFLNSDLLAQADPYGDTDHEVTLREALDNASKVLETRFADEPLVEADIRMTLARTYRRLDEIPIAMTHVERALQLRRDEHGTVHADVAAAVIELATLTSHVGEYARSETLHREALAMQRELLPPDDPALLESLNRFGVIQLAKGEFAESERILREVLDIRRTLTTGDDDLTADSMHWLAYTLRCSGQLDQAERLYVQALEMRRRIHGESHATVASSLKHLAVLDHERGAYKQSRSWFGESLAMYLAELGPDHMYTITATSSYGRLLLEIGELEDAESMLESVLHDRFTSRGDAHADTWHSRVDLALLHLARGRTDEAIQLTEPAIDILLELSAEKDPYLSEALLTHASALLAVGRVEEAVEAARHAVRIQDMITSQATLTQAHAQAVLSECLLAAGHHDAALPIIEEALATYAASSHARRPHAVHALHTAVAIYDATDRPDDAERCRRQIKLLEW